MSIGQILCPELLLSAYQQGYFPMADEFDGKIYWHCPDPRAVFPLDIIKKPRSLKQFEKKNEVYFKVDTDFEYVINKCAEREQTWISNEIIDVYTNFYYLGFAHSVETYIDGKMVGGLYGVSIGGAFFGESMFSEVSNTAKSAFYFLCERMLEKGFILLDSQYLNKFTASLGAVEIPQTVYMKLLKRALTLPCSFR